MEIDYDLITKCPYCGKENDRLAGLDNKGPEEGNIWVCWDCGNPAVFDFSCQYNVRMPTLAEKIQLFADPGMQQMWKVYRKARTTDEAIRMMR